MGAVWQRALMGDIAPLVRRPVETEADRTYREIGIRSALGATPVRLAFEATRWGLLAVGVSWVLTLPLCVAVSRRVVFDRLPVGFDAASWMATGIALGVVGLLAGLVPARRAATVDPAVTLRDH